MRVYILGAGLAGMSAANQLSKDGVEVTVLEKDSQVGGLAQSFQNEGYTYDLGPHRFHTPNPSLTEHFKDMLQGNVKEKIRKSRILLEGRFFDYPLKVGNAIFNMPPLTMVRIITDYLWIKAKNILSKAPDSNFENWVVNRFGYKLYEIYFKVYTEKTWGMPCTKLSADWAAQRITLMSLWDTIVKTLFKTGDEPRTLVSKFNYPKKGGIGALTKAYEKNVSGCGNEVKLNSKVTGFQVKDSKINVIEYEGGKYELSNEDIVFSTIPLTQMIKIINPNVPGEVLESAKNLKYRALVFVTMFFEKESFSDDHWIYLPQLTFDSNRLSESKNFNISNAPPGKTAVTFEITCQLGDDIWTMGDEQLAAKALDDAVKTGFAKKQDYLGVKVHRREYAYPIYDLEYKKNLDNCINHLKTIKNLRFFGRNGLFRYNNMDHSVDMGLTAAKSVSDENFNYEKIATQQKWFG